MTRLSVGTANARRHQGPLNVSMFSKCFLPSSFPFGIFGISELNNFEFFPPVLLADISKISSTGKKGGGGDA